MSEREVLIKLSRSLENVDKRGPILGHVRSILVNIWSPREN